LEDLMLAEFSSDFVHLAFFVAVVGGIISGFLSGFSGNSDR
jgi:hypothetical protein